MQTAAERLQATGTANALEIRGVSRYFGALAALSDINMSIRPGERRGVLGSNGAGKTTLFNCIISPGPQQREPAAGHAPASEINIIENRQSAKQ